MSEETLWIFGYGSLVWRPAFPHLRSCPAWISGFSRRFWQGSTDHRGVPGQPGRVVTLVPEAQSRLDDASLSLSTDVGLDSEVDQDGERSVVQSPPISLRSDDRCWGTAYEVPRADPEGVLARLDDRERGGYDRLSLQLTIEGQIGPDLGAERRDIAESASRTPRRMKTELDGVVYIAGSENENYLGPAPVHEIAAQVAASQGPSGPNREYVFELANSLRQMGAFDAHVFAVDRALRALTTAEAKTKPR